MLEQTALLGNLVVRAARVSENWISPQILYRVGRGQYSRTFADPRYGNRHCPQNLNSSAGLVAAYVRSVSIG